METVFPTIPKAGWPPTGHRVCLMPDIVIYAMPSFFCKSLYCVPDISVPGAPHNFILDIQYKASVVFQSIPKYIAKTQQPIGEFIGMNAVIMVLSGIRIRRRSHY